MHRRNPEWRFGPPSAPTEQVRQWWARHEPTVDRWLGELERAADPWWQSAEHAASCLVSYPEDETQGAPAWAAFDPGHFLFRYLWEGGTVGVFGSVSIFLDQLLEALRRFAADGLVDARDAERWLAQMRRAREDFLRCYDEDTPERVAVAIARRHSARF